MRKKKNAHGEIAGGLKPLFPRLWRYCLTLTGRPDAADDLAQTVCLRALEKSDLYTPGTHLDRWLFKIAQRVWLNELRAANIRRGAGLVLVEQANIADERANMETNMFARDVLRCVMELPETQRLTVLLVYVEGFSYKDAADHLDIPIGTVMSRLAAARAKLSGKITGQTSKPA